MDLFEQASKKKLRFSFGKGVISTEDLWDLDLKDLDTIAKGLNKKIKESEEESFISPPSKSSSATNLQFEVVKRVITVRLEDRDKKALASERAAKRKQLMDLISKKEVSALENKSIEELTKELEALD